MDIMFRRTSARGRRGGFSLLELLIAVSVFGVSMAAATAYQIASLALSRSNQDLAAATDAAQSVLESLRAEPEFQAIYVRYNEDPDDDPAGPAAPGNAFDVRGLEAALDDADGRVGEIVFPGDGTRLRENGNDRALGMPRDLDLDDSIDGTDQSDDYRVLPVLVRVRWRGASGNMQVQLVGTLARR